MHRRPATRVRDWLAPALLLSAAGGLAQEREGEIDLEVRGEIGLVHDTNPFRLDRRGRQRLNARDADDVGSGRLDDMVSVRDRIVEAELDVQAEPGTLFGRKVTVDLGLSYRNYQRNDGASYLTGEAVLTRKLGERGRLRIVNDFTIDRFRRNYLSAVDDRNTNGNIPKRERSYAAGTYDEWESSIRYRHRLARGGADGRIDVHLAAGYVEREYASPHGNRDRRGATYGLGIEVRITPNWTVELTQRTEHLDSPGREEVTLVDETADGFGRDMNGDGRIKRNAPLVTRVDRSRKRTRLGVETTIEFGDDWRLRVGYRERDTRYSSANPLDVNYFDGEETLGELEVALRWNFRRRWFLTAALERSRGEEVEDLGLDANAYRRDRFTLSLRHRFR